MSTTNQKAAAQEAAKVLTTLEDGGKQCLPEQELEEERWEQSEQEVHEEIVEAQITFSDKDKEDLPVLEKLVKGKLREAAEALREIRRRQLWRLMVDEAGKVVPSPFQTFDDYLEERWGHSRQWVTHLTNWLAINEELERIGMSNVHLSVRAAQGLLIGRMKEAGGLRAILEEGKQDGVPLDRDHLQEIVRRRSNYNCWSRDGQQGRTKPAAANYEEYKRDVVLVGQLGKAGSYYLFDQAIEAARNESSEGTGLADALVLLCQQQRTMPDRDRLLANFTGVALEELVERLLEIAKDVEDVQRKKTLLAERKKEIKSLLEDGGIKKLKDEAKAIESELVAVGAIKRRGKKDQLPQDDDGRGIPFPGQEKREEDQSDGADDSDSEVYSRLDTVVDELTDIAAYQWPDDEGELNAILLKTQECEEKLAEITAKAKELLADAEKPAAIPIAD